MMAVRNLMQRGVAERRSNMISEDSVFALKGEDDLVAMRPVQFASENDFQRLLFEFPALLAGEQIDAAAPCRWIQAKHEKAIPSGDGGGGRWSVDHLFLDQDAVVRELIGPYREPAAYGDQVAFANTRQLQCDCIPL